MVRELEQSSIISFKRGNYAHLPSYAKIDAPHVLAHKSMHLAMAHLRENWQTSADIQQRIIDNFKALEDSSLEIAGNLDLILDEKQRFEGNMSRDHCEVELF